MGLQKLGSALVASDRVLAIRPRAGSTCNSVEVVFENGESLMIEAAEPQKAITDYFESTENTATAGLST